jgi:two-component system cell cycle sensor histidine kinase/response regulator CckA
VSSPEVSSASPITILVVDDESLVRHVICRELWNQGFRTLEARSGEDALHLLDLAGSHVDLVITDMVLPGIDGGDLGRRLIEKRGRLPILYISAYEPKDVFHRGAPHPAAPFLKKPFTPEALMAAVSVLLPTQLQRSG